MFVLIKSKYRSELGNLIEVFQAIDLFHKWRLLHGNEARILFSQSILVSNYQTDMISFLAYSLSSIRVRNLFSLLEFLAVEQI